MADRHMPVIARQFGRPRLELRSIDACFYVIFTFITPFEVS